MTPTKQSKSKKKQVEVIVDDNSGEQYLCMGTTSKKVAFRAIRKEQRENGIDKEWRIQDESELELVPVWRTESKEWYQWGDFKPEGSVYIGSGWRWSLE